MSREADQAMADFAGLLAVEPDAARREALHTRADLLAMNTADDATMDVAQSQLLAQRVKLGQLLRDGVPPPTFLPSPTLGERLFYEHRVALFAGHKKAGKSWAMTLLARDQIAAGRPVVYIDNENGENLIASRLALVGACADDVDEYLSYVPFPTLGSVDDLRHEFDAIGEALPGALVILDSLRTFMARFDLDANANADVERFCGPIMASVKLGGLITVAIIDHANRTTRETDEYVATGAAAKAQAVDAVYFFKKEKAFSRDVQGIVKVAVKDDREGFLDFERFYRIGGQGEAAHLLFEATDASEVGTSGRITADVRQLLGDNPGQEFTKTDVRKAVKGDNSAIDAALLTLASDPSVPITTREHRAGLPRFLWDAALEPQGLGL